MEKQLGALNPGLLFSKFRKSGDDDLISIRKELNPDSVKLPRKWKLKDAAELIGCGLSDLKANIDVLELDLREINLIRDKLGVRYRRPEGSSTAIMAVVNFKGGVGKSTTCVHLAQKAAIDGLRVLMVDLDPQATTTLNLGGIIPDLELDDSDLIGEALLNNPSDLKYSIRDTYFPGVDLVPANLLLQDTDLALPNGELNNSETLGSPALRLKASLEEVKDEYDLILIDCAPNMGALTSNALIASNCLLIPVPPYSFDSASFVMLDGALANLYDRTKLPLDYIRVVITKHPGTQTAGKQEQRLRELYSPYVLDSVMYETTEIERATRRMSSVYDQVPKGKNRSTYQRAKQILDSVNNEILTDMKRLWENQSNG